MTEILHYAFWQVWDLCICLGLQLTVLNFMFGWSCFQVKLGRRRNVQKKGHLLKGGSPGFLSPTAWARENVSRVDAFCCLAIFNLIWTFQSAEIKLWVEWFLQSGKQQLKNELNQNQTKQTNNPYNDQFAICACFTAVKLLLHCYCSSPGTIFAKPCLLWGTVTCFNWARTTCDDNR